MIDQSADGCSPPCCDGDGQQGEGQQTADLSRTPSRGKWSRREHRQLGLFSVTMIIFFNVSGGPLGSESAIRHGGPLVGLSSFLVFALLYSVPQAWLGLG